MDNSATRDRRVDGRMNPKAVVLPSHHLAALALTRRLLVQTGCAVAIRQDCLVDLVVSRPEVSLVAESSGGDEPPAWPWVMS